MARTGRGQLERRACRAGGAKRERLRRVRDLARALQGLQRERQQHNRRASDDVVPEEAEAGDEEQGQHQGLRDARADQNGGRAARPNNQSNDSVVALEDTTW